jgi:hypothetical protein
MKISGSCLANCGLGSCAMAVSGPPGCIHSAHRKESLEVWLETWALKAVLLEVSRIANRMQWSFFEVIVLTNAFNSKNRHSIGSRSGKFR